MPRTPPRSLAALLAIASIALTTAGCADADPGATAPGPGIDAATAGLPETSTAPTPATTTGATGDAPAPAPRFGRTFRYGGGLAVTVAEPEPFRPSAWVQRQAGTPMRFEITVRNRTGDTWNPSQLHVRLLSAFTPATPIFDHDSQVLARPEERLADRGTVTFSVGFWVGDAEQLALELAPGFGYQPITVSLA
ncbi:hypothetical protein [Nocardioides sp. W7]|uniref:hypothetical protein n=1 Tax=Nocardioides sp. W7 TaxID=2931390 RepID=UPI001FD2F26F|nr:hypothetical protein [Nocardioides sp. W7]